MLFLNFDCGFDTSTYWLLMFILMKLVLLLKAIWGLFWALELLQKVFLVWIPKLHNFTLLIWVININLPELRAEVTLSIKTIGRFLMLKSLTFWIAWEWQIAKGYLAKPRIPSFSTYRKANHIRIYKTNLDWSMF